MSLRYIIKIANPSPYERSDFVEVDLEYLGVPLGSDPKNLQLFRRWPDGQSQEVPFQIDYPFGQGDRRILTLFSQNTPAGDPDYRQHTAEFLLVEGTHRDFRDPISLEVLRVEHYSVPGAEECNWDPNKRIIGVKLFNGGNPTTRDQVKFAGLQVYFSLVPRPEVGSPINYAGAATSVLHHRAWRGDAPEALAPLLFHPHPPEKRWGQLTHIDVNSLPWERRPYQMESLLGEPGKEPEYTLAWSNAGPLRATVTLKSSIIRVRFVGSPYFQPKERELTCHLYRIISLYPYQEFYTEQLILRPECTAGQARERVSLAFRAQYCSYIDFPEDVPQLLARFEDIPDYFAVWKSFAGQHSGYAFASEMHIRDVRAAASGIRWRLERGHEHRCVHLFPLHNYPEREFDPFHEVGHAWYERLFKPLQAIPLNRYVSP